MILLLVKLSGYILAELLPFSPDAQIALIDYYFKYSFWNNDLAIIANFVLMVGIFIYFLRALINMLKEILRAVFFALSGRASLRIISSDFKMLNIFLISVCTSIAAYFFYFIKTNYTYSKYIIASMMIISGLVLRMTEVFTLVKKDPRVMDARDAIIFSFLQVLSFVPGVPRTAIMMSFGKFLGVEKKHLVNMIFISLLPVLFLNLYHLGLSNIIPVVQTSWLLCLILFFMLIFFMGWILSIIKSTSFYKFYYYLIGLGLWTILDLLFAKR
jgi:undecaprenyl pyrophosphate phosphatase UppP